MGKLPQVRPVVGDVPLVTAGSDEAAELFDKVFSPGRVQMGRPRPRSITFPSLDDGLDVQWRVESEERGSRSRNSEDGWDVSDVTDSF